MSEQDGFNFDGVPYEDEPQEPDICRNRHGGEHFSEEANKDVAKRKSSQRDKMAEYVLSVPNAICEEVEDALDMLRSSGSARWSELKKSGVIVPVFDGDAQAFRLTTSGSKAGVYRHVRNGDTLAANAKADSPLDQPPSVRAIP